MLQAEFNEKRKKQKQKINEENDNDSITPEENVEFFNIMGDYLMWNILDAYCFRIGIPCKLYTYND